MTTAFSHARCEKRTVREHDPFKVTWVPPRAVGHGGKQIFLPIQLPLLDLRVDEFVSDVGLRVLIELQIHDQPQALVDPMGFRCGLVPLIGQNHAEPLAGIGKIVLRLAPRLEELVGVAEMDFPVRIIASEFRQPAFDYIHFATVLGHFVRDGLRLIELVAVLAPLLAAHERPVQNAREFVAKLTLEVGVTFFGRNRHCERNQLHATPDTVIVALDRWFVVTGEPELKPRLELEGIPVEQASGDVFAARVPLHGFFAKVASFFDFTHGDQTLSRETCDFAARCVCTHRRPTVLVEQHVAVGLSAQITEQGAQHIQKGRFPVCATAKCEEEGMFRRQCGQRIADSAAHVLHQLDVPVHDLKQERFPQRACRIRIVIDCCCIGNMQLRIHRDE